MMIANRMSGSLNRGINIEITPIITTTRMMINIGIYAIAR